MPERTYMSIGDVLALLREEFPDITISKIRFLESRGLLVPERTPSGYRKFYEQDVDRLRWILRQQREHFLPLKVIKGRLEGQDPGSERQHLFDVPQGAKPHGHEERNGTLPVASPTPTQARAAAPEADGPSAEAMGDESGRDELAAAAFAASTAAARRELRHLAEESVAGRASGTTERGGVAVVSPPAPRTTAVRDKSDPGTGGPPTGERAAEERAEEEAAAGKKAAGEKAAPHLEAEERHMGERDSPGGSGTAARQATHGHLDEPPAEGAAAVGSQRAASGSERPATGGGGHKARRVEDTVTRTSGAAFSANELANASGLSVHLVEELEEFGLISGRNVAGVHCFDEEAVGIASLAAHFAKFGVEARHLRLFKHAAERQAGLYSQVVMPVLRQRNPEARQRASDDLARLAELGAELQASFVRGMLRDFTGG